MKLSIICFTEAGAQLAKKIAHGLNIDDWDTECFITDKYADITGMKPSGDLKAWCGRQWKNSDCILFIGAAGIAVRAIAPYVADKTCDPAVIVAGQDGKFVISLLSGHIGGANAFTREIAKITGGQAVITTATDIAGKFAVDVFAKKNGLLISSMPMAKEVSAAVLRGEKIGFFSEFPYAGEVPAELTPNVRQKTDIYVGYKSAETDGLLLTPVNLILGVGCKRGTEPEKIRDAFCDFMEKNGYPQKAVSLICSADIKKNEAGILALADELNTEFRTFSTEELNAVQGSVSSSEFVKSVTGTDCVCERAVLCCGGELLIKKTVYPGITFALGMTERVLYFE